MSSLSLGYHRYSIQNDALKTKQKILNNFNNQSISRMFFSKRVSESPQLLPIGLNFHPF